MGLFWKKYAKSFDDRPEGVGAKKPNCFNLKFPDYV